MSARRACLGVVFGSMASLGAWLLPAALWGQAVTVATAGIYANATPAELMERAGSLFDTPARFGEAGDMLQAAGQKLAVEDPASVQLLVKAARLQYFAGNLAAARANLKEAGWRALGQGDVATAADLYGDAAIIAIEQKDATAANELVRIVRLLADWPGVTPSQHRRIMKRLG